MASYIGNQDNPGHLVEAGEAVSARFDARQHAAIAKEVHAFLAIWKRFAAASKVRDAAMVKEEQARSVLADADAARDAAVLALDRALIGAGEPKKNSFKRFGALAPSRFVQLAYAEETAAVKKLISAVQRSGVSVDVKALTRANDAVIAAEQRVEVAAAAASKARAARDALDRPTRAALSVLKLQVRVAEKLGLTGAYAQLFAA